MNPSTGGNGSNHYRRYPNYQLQVDPSGGNGTPYGGFGGISIPPPNEWRGPSIPSPSEWRGPSIPPPNEWRGPSIPPPSEWRGPSIPPPNEWRGPSIPPPSEWRGPSIPPPSEWRGPSIPPPNEWGRGLPDIPPISEWELPDWLKGRTKIFPDNIGKPCIPTADMTFKDFPFYGEVMLPEYKIVKCNTLAGYCPSQRISYFLPKVRICYSKSLGRDIYEALIEKVEACVNSALKSATKRFVVTLGVSEILFGTTLPLAIQDAYNVFEDEFLDCLSRLPETFNAKDYIQFSVFAERTARSGDWSR